MNNKSKVFIGLLTFILVSTVIGQNQSQVFLGISKTFKLTGQKPFIGKYQLSIDKKDVPKVSRWYLFAMAQPLEQSTQLFGSPIKISIMKGADIIQSCKFIQQSDACFIHNYQFDFTKDNLTISIQCDESCQFQLATQIDYAYPLKMDTPFKLDFQNSAYTKIFTLNTEGKDFYQLRLTLQPRGFINYGQPIVLLANYGNQIPTQLGHDFKGIHTWDDGQGIFVRKSQLRSPILTILVEGPQKNVLELIAKGWQKQEKLVLREYLPEFDWIKGGQTRQVALTINEKMYTHRVKVIVFTGSIQNLQVFKTDERDSGRLSPVKFSMPAQKYGEFQFRFAKQLIQKENLKNVIIKLIARKDTTYVINYAREQSSITAIFPYVSQSSLMEPGQTDQYYVKVQQLIETTKQKKTSKIQLIVGNIQGNVELSFYKCNSVYKAGIDNLKNCQVNSNNIRDFQQIEPVRYENRGGQKRYWFQISWADQIKRTDRDKTQVVYQMAVLVKNKYTQKTSSYQIQYKNKDRIYLLKQGELTKDRVFINQKRHYKLSIQDKDATEVRIHCTRISGQAFFVGSFVDPRVNKDHEKTLPLYGILTLKLNPQQHVSEVFLQVQGVDNAYYSLTTQIIRKSQANPKKNGTTGYNELIVRQGFPYQFLIAPLETIVLQIHATQRLVSINMKSSSAVSICMTQNLKSPPFAPNCEIKNDFFLQMNQKFTMQKGLIGNIGVKNPDTKKNVSIKIMVQNPKSNQKKDESEKQICQIGVINEVLFKKIGKNGKDSDGDPVHCLDYNLNKNQEIELIVDLKGQHLYDQGKITASINDQQKIRILSPSHIFKKQQVQSACMKRQGNTQNFCYLKVSFQGITDTKVRVLAQYTSQAIRLIDGIAHPVHSQMIKNKPKHFYLGIHNVQNITLYLQNRIGEYKIYANLMPYSTFATKNNPSVYPTKQFKDIQSTNPFYNLQQILIVPSSNISDKCPDGQDRGFGKKWLDCVLLISIYLDGTSEIQNNGKFVIQATQQNRQLKDGIPLSGFLQKKSTAFYHFQNQRSNGTMVITVNNQNKNCLDIFLRQGSQRATSQYNQKHAKASNILLYNVQKIGTYSITLEANENCPYTITVTSSKNNITRVKKGTFADINLPIDGQKYFIFQNLINQTFKVLSIHKSGQVIISVNPIPRNQLLVVLQSDLSTIKSWTWSNKDSVRISSIDRKNGQNTKYCVDCYYLINVKAIRQTQASIVIPTSGSDLPITTDAITQDTLLKDESTTYRIFAQTNSQFEVYVQYGKIQISISESDKDVPSYNKTFQPSKAPILQKFSIAKAQQFDFLRYVKIVIKAHQDSYFSFSIVSSTDPTRRGPGLKYGIPQYIFLESNKQKCVSGTMTVKIDQLLLSFSKSERRTIQKMQIKVKINNRQTTMDKQYGNNEMLLRINELGAQSTQNKKFDICLKSMTAVSITLIQSSPLNYWPQKQSILIKKQANLTFASQGKGIIELNQCQSRASAQLFSQFNDMKNPGSQIKQRRRSNNIIQFYHYGPVYIKAKSQKATVKWISINETSGVGLGYEQYRSGSLRFSKQGNNLLVMAQQIKATDQKSLSGSITSVKYQFYAASEQMQLFNAMNCGQGIFVKKVIQSSGTQKNNPIFKASFDIKNELKPIFGQQKYFLINVKAIVSIKVQNQIQQYRFFYPYQQLNKQLLYTEQNIQPDVIQPEDQLDEQSEFLTILGYILIAIILFGAVYLVYSKCIKKYLAKKQKQSEFLGKQMKYFDLSQH